MPKTLRANIRPEDRRSENPDARTRDWNRKAIRRTVAWVSPEGDPRLLEAIAQRESAWNHTAVSRSQLDKNGGRRAFRRLRDRIEAEGNPHTSDEDEEYWANSYGLFQHMPAYHLRKVNPAYHPYSLFHPVVATLAAMRGVNAAQGLGAKDATDVRWVWWRGSMRGKYQSDGTLNPDYLKRRASVRARFQNLFGDAGLAERPLREWGYGPAELAPQEWDPDLIFEVSRSVGFPGEEQRWQHFPVNYPRQAPPKPVTPTRPTTPTRPPSAEEDTCPPGLAWWWLVVAAAGGLALGGAKRKKRG